jgi:hypothetical protein
MYQAKKKSKHIYDLISGPQQSVQVPLCTLTVIGPELVLMLGFDLFYVLLALCLNV